MYETTDTLTHIQATEFLRLLAENIGVDYELNESASGEPDQYYIFISELEEDEEYIQCAQFEKQALKM